MAKLLCSLTACHASVFTFQFCHGVKHLDEPGHDWSSHGVRHLEEPGHDWSNWSMRVEKWCWCYFPLVKWHCAWNPWDFEFWWKSTPTFFGGIPSTDLIHDNASVKWSIRIELDLLKTDFTEGGWAPDIFHFTNSIWHDLSSRMKTRKFSTTLLTNCNSAIWAPFVA